MKRSNQRVESGCQHRLHRYHMFHDARRSCSRSEYSILLRLPYVRRTVHCCTAQYNTVPHKFVFFLSLRRPFSSSMGITEDQMNQVPEKRYLFQRSALKLNPSIVKLVHLGFVFIFQVKSVPMQQHITHLGVSHTCPRTPKKQG